MSSTVHTVRAPRGTELNCLGWPQEAAYRMLHNNLDPEVAERPEDLVVYGGTGKAARDWPSFDAIARTLRTLKQDETLLVQSGRPVGVMATHEWAPRVLLANSNLVGDWASWEEFRRLEALGLTMYGQMTAGSWIYIGSQGILQGTYETFAAVGDKRFNGSLAGTITLTAGLGGMGGAQPLAVTMAGGVAICIEVDPSRIARRIAHGYLDTEATLDEALRLATQARDEKRPLSIGVHGNAADLVPRLLAMGAPIDVVTDQTSAHDPLAYLPAGVPFEDWRELASRDPEVAERPDDLVVYGGTGRAARDWASFDAMVRTLTTLAEDETMLVQSGRPVGVLRTHEWAPRVLIANSNLVGDWATWPEFRRLERLGLTMYGQMTAGSWIYIGTQGILQGTYETFAAVEEAVGPLA